MNTAYKHEPQRHHGRREIPFQRLCEGFESEDGRFHKALQSTSVVYLGTRKEISCPVSMRRGYSIVLVNVPETNFVEMTKKEHLVAFAVPATKV
jgi:hypothetical protein